MGLLKILLFSKEVDDYEKKDNRNNSLSNDNTRTGIRQYLGGGPCWDESFFGGHHGYGGHFFGGGIFMWILNILLLGAVIFIAVKFFAAVAMEAKSPSIY